MDYRPPSLQGGPCASSQTTRWQTARSVEIGASVTCECASEAQAKAGVHGTRVCEVVAANRPIEGSSIQAMIKMESRISNNVEGGKE